MANFVKPPVLKATSHACPVEYNSANTFPVFDPKRNQVLMLNSNIHAVQRFNVEEKRWDKLAELADPGPRRR